MILLSYSNSSIKGTEILGSILYLSLLRPAIFVCMQSGRKLIIFHFNSWLSFQRQCRLLQGYKLPSGQRIFTIGRITVLSPLAAASGFVRPWPHLIHYKRGWTHCHCLNRFSRTHGRDQQTHTHTDRPRYSVCSNSPHLMQCMRCDLKVRKTKDTDVVVMRWLNILCRSAHSRVIPIKRHFQQF